jgi:hypothetical protein
MSNPHDSSSPSYYIQNALEAACDSLMALESIRAPAETPGSAVDGSQLHVGQAIASLRHAISELRLAHDHDASMVGLGFVVATAPVRPPKRHRRGGQSSPRRTA